MKVKYPQPEFILRGFHEIISHSNNLQFSLNVENYSQTPDYNIKLVFDLNSTNPSYGAKYMITELWGCSGGSKLVDKDCQCQSGKYLFND
jgi:hypothetical protein